MHLRQRRAESLKRQCLEKSVRKRLVLISIFCWFNTLSFAISSERAWQYYLINLLLLLFYFFYYTFYPCFLFFLIHIFTFFILLFYRPRFGSLAVTAQQWPRRGRRQVGADNTVLIPLVYSRSSFSHLLSCFYSRTCSTISHTYFPSDKQCSSRKGRNFSSVTYRRTLLRQRKPLFAPASAIRWFGHPAKEDEKISVK